MKQCVLFIIVFGFDVVVGSRVLQRVSVRQQEKDVDSQQKNDEGEEVDFSFMTTDLRYPAHDPGFFGSMEEWFGGRATSDEVKEDIVQAHTCAKRGNPDETYYASSFCYWVPEFSTRSSSRGGLAWRGGNYPNGKQLSQGVKASGQCVKASVCHNNARSDDGDVHTANFVEEVLLPSGCLKEREIEAQCVTKYDGENVALKAEDARCREVEGRYSRAVQSLNQCNSKLISLPDEIHNVFPGRIQRAEHEVIRNEERVRYARRHEQSEQSQMHRRCHSFLGFHSYSSFCSYPHRPMDHHDGQHAAEMMRYHNEMQVYQACKECESAKNDLQRATRKLESSERELRQSRQRVPQLQQEMNLRVRELSEWQSWQPGLQSTKLEMDDEWLPQSSGCKKTYSDYKNGKAWAVTKCAPGFYEDSCEKACIEQQGRNGGCGVVEGSRSIDTTGFGGVEVKCEPIQPSWVLGPFTYGAREVQGEQCDRIQAHQKVQYATKILKSGWLWKKGRDKGWDKRYFQLESGDAVRSAVMRYWTKDPTKISNAEERAHKGIILRDAKSVKAKFGTDYGFKDGEQCFKLYHFYRNYRLCVTSESGTKAQEEDDRDEWMRLIEDSIIG